MTKSEVRLLESLEQSEHQVKPQTAIRQAGESAGNFYTLKSGWAVAEQCLEGGRRQIIDVFVPGQIIGLREIAYQTGLCTFTSLTDAVVCPFPKVRIAEVFDQSRHLTDLFFLILAREQATLVERIVNMGRRSAIEKLAHFLLELQQRIKVTHPDADKSYQLPLTPRAIGDTLGLSSVQVNRSFARLAAERMIKRNDQHIEITNLEALQQLAGFNRDYLEIDLSWVRTLHND